MKQSIRFRAALVLAGLCGVHAVPDGGAEAGASGRHEVIVDFRASFPPWRSIDDVVMGGLSRSAMIVEDGIAVFRGVVSLDNNGGFASVRSEPADHDLSAFDGLVLRVRGDGKRYAFRLRTTAALDGPSYQAVIEPAAGIWQEVTVPFHSFEPVFRGRRLPDHPPLDPSRVKTFGLLIADRQAGPFRLELAWVKGFGGHA